MQSGSPASGVALRGAIHDSVFGQADQQVDIDVGVCQRFEIVAAVQGHHRPRRVRGLRFTHGRNLVERHLRRRAGRWTAALGRRVATPNRPLRP
jgi:hypothetical protein